MPISDKEISGEYGWLGFEKERKAKELNYQLGLMIDFAQWSDVEPDANFVEIFDFPFDDGFAFWPILERVYGKPFPNDPQSVGNCVPYGSCLANLDRIATELLIDGDAEAFFIPFVPFSYGAGRVYVGNVSWSGHGSVGSWQIAADMRYGLLPCDLPDMPIRRADDLQGSAKTNELWMNTKVILDGWKDDAAKLTIGEGSEIASFEQLKIAVVQKKQPVTIASNWGFVTLGKDTKYGIVTHRKGGSWSHQMHIRAVFEIKGQWFVYVGNQWGDDAHPEVAEGFVKGGFVITAELFDTWVKEAECYVRGSINGRMYKPDFAFL
jgi:hypothetical protein